MRTKSAKTRSKRSDKTRPKNVKKQEKLNEISEDIRKEEDDITKCEREAIIKKAIDEVFNGKQTIGGTAKKYGLTRSVLRYRLKNPDPRKRGKSAFTPEEEDEIVEWINDSIRRNFSVTSKDIMKYATSLNHRRPNSRFKYGKPCKGWYERFLFRHPELVYRITKLKSSQSEKSLARARISEDDIRDWFKRVQDYITTNQMDEILNEPKRIFNCAEIAFDVFSKDNRSIPRKNKAILAVNAAGDMATPMVLMQYKKLPEVIKRSLPYGWIVGNSKEDSSPKGLFYEYITKVFHPFLKERKIKLPVLLFVDHCERYLTMDVTTICSDLNIVLISFYPDSSHILQPVNLGLFDSLKVGWRELVVAWRNENSPDAFTLEYFPALLQKTITIYYEKKSAIIGFQNTGIYPWNPDIIDYSKCLPKKKTISINKKPHCSMNKLEFRNIIGQDLYEQLQNGMPVFDDNPELCQLMMKEMFTHFEGTNYSDESINTEVEVLDEAINTVEEVLEETVNTEDEVLEETIVTDDPNVSEGIINIEIIPSDDVIE